MPDLYLRIAEQSEDILDAIAASMDKRAAEPAMRKICDAYMGEIPGPGADVLEIGCGNGAATGQLHEIIAPRTLTGIDPSEGLVARARERFRGVDGMRFAVGDAVRSGQADRSFDVVVAHTVYSHLTDPTGALAEAYRVLRPGGTIAIFDGDYATNTVALFDGDPLQAAMTATQRNVIHDPYIMRRLPGLVRSAGFAVRQVEAHAYVQTQSADYLRSLMARGVDAATLAGECGSELAEGFKSEAARRVDDGSFYGAILFISVIAEKSLEG
jgi:ubiquinone/menaquinone biosynthesis C-methylase UbiE